MDLLIGVLTLLFYVGILVLVVVILQWGLAYLGITIPDQIMKIVWFLIIILVLIAIVTFLAGGIHVPKLGVFPR